MAVDRRLHQGRPAALCRRIHVGLRMSTGQRQRRTTPPPAPRDRAFTLARIHTHTHTRLRRPASRVRQTSAPGPPRACSHPARAHGHPSSAQPIGRDTCSHGTHTHLGREELAEAGVVALLRRRHQGRRAVFCRRFHVGLMMMIVYWYSFSNHYTRECIHTCERERTCGSSQSSPGSMLAPSSWCRHALHAHHPPSPPCLVSSQAGFGMQCYSPLHARWPQCVYRGRVQADPVYLWSSLHAPPRLHRQLIYTYGFSPHNLTTFRFRLWLPSAPASPPEASTAIFSSAFLPSRRSFLLPPVPLLHYFFFFFCRVCARTTLPPLRLG